MQDFFTNDLLIHANQNAVMAILANPRKLIEWDPEIQSAKISMVIVLSFYERTAR